MLPPPAAQKFGDRRARTKERPVHVDRENTAPYVRRSTLYLPEMCDPGVVDEDLEPGKGVERRLDGGFVGDVQAQGERPGARLLDQPRRLAGALFVPRIAEGDVAPGAGERRTDRPADAAGAARHKDHAHRQPPTSGRPNSATISRATSSTPLPFVSTV